MYHLNKYTSKIQCFFFFLCAVYLQPDLLNLEGRNTPHPHLNCMGKTSPRPAEMFTGITHLHTPTFYHTIPPTGNTPSIRGYNPLYINTMVSCFHRIISNCQTIYPRNSLHIIFRWGIIYSLNISGSLKPFQRITAAFSMQEWMTYKGEIKRNF